jgi:hypothetical protein
LPSQPARDVLPAGSIYFKSERTRQNSAKKELAKKNVSLPRRTEVIENMNKFCSRNIKAFNAQQGGEIVEQGARSEPIAKGGMYKKLCGLQTFK